MTQEIPYQPFDTVEECWFWTMSSLMARRDGTGRPIPSPIKRPCDPDDVVKVLDRLYRQRKIDLQHARILRIWGERGIAPNPRFASERGDLRIWVEAITALYPPLRQKGIVAQERPKAVNDND